MKAFTDYPFKELGDPEFILAPIREVEVLSYDGDKYCNIIINGVHLSVKACYLYAQPGRVGTIPPFIINEES